MTTQSINRYDEIKIMPNSLIVLDIDETLIKFDNIYCTWWNIEFIKIYTETKKYDVTEKMLLNKWLNIVSNLKPSLVDNCAHEFIEEAKQNNCKIILLTARKKDFFDLTLKHLNEVDLNFSHIYFNGNKGNELVKIITNEFSDCEEIIVVDDLISKLEDIKEKLLNSHIKKNCIYTIC